MILVIVLATATVPSASFPDETSDEAGVEAAARRLVKMIYERDYDGIVAMVPDDGVSDSDSQIAKATIEKELRDPSSYLRRKLYEPLSADTLTTCVEKLDGKTLVSPAVFYAIHGDEFEVSASRMDGFDGYFGVTFKSAGADRRVNQCQPWLWWLTMRKIGDDFFIASYLFD